MKFVFCGFDFFDECLKVCLSEGHQLLAAFSQSVDGQYNSSRSVDSICTAQGIKVTTGKITASDIQSFAAQGCDFLLSAAYAHRIPANELERVGIKGVNIHPTLLPEGRGPWPLPHIILKGLNHSGVTIHKLSDEFDSGDILSQNHFDVLPNENLETLSCKVQIAASNLTRDFIKNIQTIWASGSKQESGTYWPMAVEAERVLDWTKSVKDIDRVVRAFGKFDSWANFDGRDWLVQDATVWIEKHEFGPGQVVHRTNREVLIAAQDGLVCLRQFRPETEKI